MHSQLPHFLVIIAVGVAGNEFNIKAKCVVNATGPYTDFIRELDDSDSRKICQPSSGVHIILPDYYRYVICSTSHSFIVKPCAGFLSLLKSAVFFY